MSETTTNGRTTRKSLAQQLDRLDSILDGLSEGLNEAIAGAVQQATTTAVEQAVRQALVEVLSNPDVLTVIGQAAHLHAAPLPAAHAANDHDERPGVGQRLQALGKSAGQQLRDACSRAASVARRGLVGLWLLRRPLLLVAGAGFALGLLSYGAGPWLSGLVGGLVAVSYTLASRARRWL